MHLISVRSVVHQERAKPPKGSEGQTDDAKPQPANPAAQIFPGPLTPDWLLVSRGSSYPHATDLKGSVCRLGSSAPNAYTEPWAVADVPARWLLGRRVTLSVLPLAHGVIEAFTSANCDRKDG